ncbi:MAG: dihydroneopterin aldolase [Candidatus Cloacimonetes bacterium]|nr:dihydroneopterin aldolase [Candidatus Cloacimonadota bacterium]
MDKISLSGIRVNANIGITDQEKMLEQEVYVDTHLYYDFKKIQQTDDLKDGVNYSEVISFLRHLASENQTNTLEAFANMIAVETKKQFKLSKIKVGVESARFTEELDLDEIKLYVKR